MAKKNIIKKSMVKEFAKGMNISRDFPEVLSIKCEKLINDAIERAKANGRRTLKSRDL